MIARELSDRALGAATLAVVLEHRKHIRETPPLGCLSCGCCRLPALVAVPLRPTGSGSGASKANCGPRLQGDAAPSWTTLAVFRVKYVGPLGH